MSNLDDKQYADYLMRLSSRFKQNTAGRPVFTVNYDTTRAWKKYLSSFSDPQYHNCNCCHSFINRYAGLVVVDPTTGLTSSAMWSEEDCPDDRETRAALRWLIGYAEDSKITGVFYSVEPILGYDVHGEWRHLHLFNPAVFTAPSGQHQQTDAQAMAEKREDYKNVQRAMREYSPKVLDTALRILDSKALYRSEKVRGPALWLADLHAACENKTGPHQRDNLVWLAVATAPPGYAHIRSRMLGTLLDDIAAGLPFDDIKKRFDAKMDPSEYQRAGTAPTAQQVEIAEAAVEALGIVPSFERRYTEPDDVFAAIDGVLWTPSEFVAQQPAPTAKKSGVFSDLAPTKTTVAPDLDIPPRTMTWEKFAREILPGAAKIEYRVPRIGRFAALTTAADRNAPPILQWDGIAERNPVAWSFPNPPARAEQWNLVAGSLAPVRCIVTTPNTWLDKQGAEQHGEGVFLLIEDARDTRDLPGGGLFVEHLRSDLRPFRTVIEAHLNRLRVQGEGKLAFGVGLLAGHEWTESAAPVVKTTAPYGGPVPDNVEVLLVVDDSGSMNNYLGAAHAALRSLLEATCAMPGNVRYTVIRFGSVVDVIYTAVPYEMLEGLEKRFNASSGMTALNDAIGRAIDTGRSMQRRGSTSYFLGIVTDGQENKSSKYTAAALVPLIRWALDTGDWTIAYAGAGANPLNYARSIGIPEGNSTVFEASARGFEDVGQRYAASTRSLADAYRAGAKATTQFFGAASARQALGKDHPVLVVTARSGAKSAYQLDRWE